jgi:hypothetical protein
VGQRHGRRGASLRPLRSLGYCRDGTGPGSPSSVMLEVEQVLCILGHHSHADAKVWALKVRHGLKALLPHRVFLISNWEKCNRHRGGSGEATLTQRGERDMGHLLDGGVRLAADDSPHPWILLVEGYHHSGLAS